LEDKPEKQSPDLGSGQPGKGDPKPDITFTADGKQKVKGAVHDTSMASIQNTR
jgi:hypothetical protein